MNAPPALARARRDPPARGRDGRHPATDPLEPRTRLRGARHLRPGGRAPAGWGYEVHRGLGGTGVVGTLRVGTRQAPHRPARRHGRAADRRDHRQAVGQPGARQDARLRPRRPHRDAAGRGAPPGGDAPLRRHAEPDLPAGRGGAARRQAHDRRRPVRALFPCDAIFGMHNMPGLPRRAASASLPGSTMASSDSCVITVRGNGGHGAMPHVSGRPVVAARAS